MTRPAALATAGVALLLALACSPTRTTLDTPEPTMPHTESPEPPPEPTTPEPEPSPGVDPEDEREARAVVEGYVAAITARDEPTAAGFTCRKKDGGLLWISSAGRPITVITVRIGGTIDGIPVALAQIQVAGKPKSALTLEKRDGTWCVWL